MRRIIALLALALCMLSVCCRPAVEYGGKSLTEHVLDRSVAIAAVIQGKTSAVCGGTWISESDIITAEHCLNDADPPPQDLFENLLRQLGADMPMEMKTWMVEDDLDATRQIHYFTRDLKVHVTTLIASDEKLDLALLHDAHPPVHEVAPLRRETIPLGTPIVTVGSPDGLWFTFEHGWLSGDREPAAKDDRPFRRLQIQVPTWYGHSGGGAFDEQGQLLGVCDYITDFPGTGFFVRYDVVQEFIRRAHH